jgi:HAD superfamily hydrolase (TIGR01459 family)
MSASPRQPEEITGLQTILDRFDDVLLDQWGSLHEGRAIFPAARDCVARLRAAGKRVAILSNSGKRAVDNERRLAKLGLLRGEYDLLLTSGEVTWRGLRDHVDPTFAPFRGACLLITRDGDTSIIEGLDIQPVDDIAAAGFLLLAGLDEDRSTPALWRDLLAAATQRHLPMLCANPDLTMFGQDGLAPAPGALARFYETMGGRVVYVGKPHAPIFDAALAALGRPARRRVLVIGDSLDHDVQGGRAAGMPTLLISDGVHAADLALLANSDGMPAALRVLAGNDERMPDWVIPHLTW